MVDIGNPFIPCHCGIKNIDLLHFSLNTENKTVERGIVMLFGNFIKSEKLSLHQLNSKTNDLVLLLKTI